MADFAQQIAAFVKKTEARADQVLRKVGIEVASSVVRKSPVDTGRFRANWLASIEAPNTRTFDASDLSGQATIAAAARQINKARLGQVIWISNNLPYAQRLENGYSQQAPSGMVRVTVAEWQGYLNRVAKQL